MTSTSAERRERKRAADRACYAAMTPEQQEAKRAYRVAYHALRRDENLALMKRYRDDPVTGAKKKADNDAWYAANKDVVRDRQAERRGMTRREWNLQKTYGLTLEDYDHMLAEQGGGCATCGTTEAGNHSKAGNFLHVDHDHATGEVRGLLCGSCNRALGHVDDSVERLMSLAAYLLRQQDVLNPVK